MVSDEKVEKDNTVIGIAFKSFSSSGLDNGQRTPPRKKLVISGVQGGLQHWKMF